MTRVAPTAAAQSVIEKLKQDGFYKGFTLIDIKSVMNCGNPRTAARAFASTWAKRGVKTEGIGWRWLGTPSEGPTLLVAYKGAMSPDAAFQMCKYVFGGNNDKKTVF